MVKIMKIRYNIAEKKRMNYVRFFIFAGILAVLSLGFILLGTINLATTAKQFEDKKAELKLIEDKLQDTSNKNQEQKSEIDGIKKKWDKELKFVNNLISSKNFPFLEMLGKLEEALPAGVFITKLSLDKDTGKRIQFTIAAISSPKLAEAYSVFLKYYDASIKKEASGEGFYYADLQLKLE